MAIPGDRNVTQKEAEEGVKYNSVCMEITMNVEREIYERTGNNWKHRNNNRSLKKNLEPISGGGELID